ncbi:hypothetical protein MSG28_001649 [Choristoneura fumiferana]|uniref:Uncharacterized protein n=1 Tax=Choristoneura fumiferana TaxID=7141 RepID=A0ACC0KUS8_CHOFU|nr:hypothetical protein MSG28_001649 [Choristoneura fumiferana]
MKTQKDRGIEVACIKHVTFAILHEPYGDYKSNLMGSGERRASTSPTKRLHTAQPEPPKANGLILGKLAT